MATGQLIIPDYYSSLGDPKEIPGFDHTLRPLSELPHLYLRDVIGLKLDTYAPKQFQGRTYKEPKLGITKTQENLINELLRSVDTAVKFAMQTYIGEGHTARNQTDTLNKIIASLEGYAGQVNKTLEQFRVIHTNQLSSTDSLMTIGIMDGIEHVLFKNPAGRATEISWITVQEALKLKIRQSEINDRFHSG